MADCDTVDVERTDLLVTVTMHEIISSRDTTTRSMIKGIYQCIV